MDNKEGLNTYLNTIVLADALEVLPKMPPDSVDLILTDPPYMISSEVTIKRSRNPLKYKYTGKDIKLHFGDWDTQWESKEAHREWMKAWMWEAFRILRKGGHFVCFVDAYEVSHYIEYGRLCGMVPRQMLHWIKKNPTPQARKVSFMNAIEYAIWLTKETTSKRYATFNHELGQHPNYLVHEIVPKHSKKDGTRIHPTQKPVKWCLWVINYLTKPGDTVLDPFCGGGTTCVAALKSQRNFIGIEIDPQYHLLAERRVKMATAQGMLDFSEKSGEGEPICQE